MTLASHYVIGDILDSLDDDKVAGNVFEKFCKRYSDDIELAEVCKKFRKYLKSGNPKLLDEVKKRLKGLEEGRGIGTGGGEMLWYSDRRPGRSV